jgi:hypothetical protein
MLVFDIETGPLPEETLRGIYQEPTLDEFAATCDKRWKPETVAAKYEEAKAGMWAEFVGKAALSPLTGRVLAIGYQLPNGRQVIHHHEANDQEPGMLQSFWQIVQKAIAAKEKIVGHNIEGFDLPFLLRSSWLYRIDVPEEIFDGRYWHRVFLDTMKRWQCGNYREQYAKLDVLAKAFGLIGKLDEGGVSGAEFANFYWGSPEDRELALQYLRRDIEMTAAIAGKMGVI